jgi:hypothetical protein
VIKVTSTDFGTRSKVFKAQNTIIKNFNLVPNFIKTFDLVPKSDKIYQNFQSSAKTHFGSNVNFLKTLNLVKNDTFNLVKFDLPIPTLQ